MIEPALVLNEYIHVVCKVTRLSLHPQREKIKEKFVAALKEEFAGKGLQFSKGKCLAESYGAPKGT